VAAPEKRGDPVQMLMRCFMRSRSGFTLVEYGVAAAIVALVIMLATSSGTS
jgi:Flp pilus assembly pilin Flp